MLEKLKKEVYEANLALPKNKLVKHTWGNVSAYDPETGYVVIKPSGVSYETMTVDDMVVVDLEGNLIEGTLNPSSDTATHLVIYKNFKSVRSVVHTHSTWATIWSQSGLDLPALGTTHADTFYGEVPCARFLSQEEIDSGYEENTGRLIIETFKERGLDPLAVPGVLLNGHGPFTWGETAGEAVLNALVLEEISKIAYHTRNLNPASYRLPQRVLDKHYFRKHGEDAYYGQNN